MYDSKRAQREPIGARRVFMLALKRDGFAKMEKSIDIEDGGNVFL
jgi:hypothetical protein